MVGILCLDHTSRRDGVKIFGHKVYRPQYLLRSKSMKRTHLLTMRSNLNAQTLVPSIPRYRPCASDSLDEDEPLFVGRPTRFDLGTSSSPASLTPPRRGLFVNKRGRPRLRPRSRKYAGSLPCMLPASNFFWAS